MSRGPSRERWQEGAGVLRAGYYRYRLVKGGPWLPARVEFRSWSLDDEGRKAHDRWRMVLILGGEEHHWPDPARWLHRLHPCTQAEYSALTKIPAGVDPTQRVDLRALPPLI